MWAAWIPIVAATGCIGCNDGIAAIGERCDTVADCGGNLQCLDHICKPGCNSNAACGDGMLCEGHECIAVESVVGAPCDAELECGPGQTCRLPANLEPRAGFCALESRAAPLGSPCNVDVDCRAGTCALGRCTALCKESQQCLLNEICANIPWVKPDFSGLIGNFRGCLPSLGNLSFDIPIAPTTEAATLTIPVASNAKSMVLISEVLGSTQIIGATSVIDPRGASIYTKPETTDDYYLQDCSLDAEGNRLCQYLRHQPLTGISVLAIPSTSKAPLLSGPYTVGIGTFFSDNTPSTEPPRRLRVVEKLGKEAPTTGASLELHFYFLDLEDHPCGDKVDVLRAGVAPTSPEFESYLEALRDIFYPHVTIPTPSFTDLSDLPHLDALDTSRAGDLFELSTAERGISIYFVRSLTPAGHEIAVGGTPGSPLPGTRASGIAISATALCYQSWETLARQTAHAIARHAGLYRNLEPDGRYRDPIDDSPDGIENLMSWAENGGTALSPEQIGILRNSPVVR